jgi:3-oxoacyl-[acyl-carrier protein] reductase
LAPGSPILLSRLGEPKDLRRQWACELGKHGIRVITRKTGGIPESISDTEPLKQGIAYGIEKPTLPKHAAILADVGNVAAFVASDLAPQNCSSISGCAVNVRVV